MSNFVYNLIRMDSSTEITYQTLLEEGKQIRALIKYVPEGPNVIFRAYDEYQITDTLRYETWRNLVINLLLAKNEEQRVQDFKSATEEFKKKHYSPECFDNMLGIVNACQFVPCQLNPKSSANSNDKAIVLNVNQTQSQTQSQEQKIVVDVFLEAIKDELTGKQFRELKDIAKDEIDPKKARNKILDKIKSWGEGISESIVANIITNPNVWSGLI